MKPPKRIAIIGYGIEGKSAHRFLRTTFPKAHIEIRDKKENPDYLNDLESFDMLVRSPGVPYLLPEIQRAEKRGVAVSSVTKLFFQYAKGTIIGITGTKGKGTTASMLLSILKAAKKKVFLVGNIGVPMLSVLPKLSRTTTTIVELSSFQLQDLKTSPHIAMVLEIAPDHQDYHTSMREYVRAKSNIARYQKKRDACVYVKRNTCSSAIARLSAGKRIGVDVVEEGMYWEDILTVPGQYNTHNAAVAANAARALSIDETYIAKGLRAFKGLPYHMEVAAVQNGIRYINDSASTNPISTKAALESISGPVVLIAGGVDKNFDYRALAPVIRSRDVRGVVLFGRNKKTIRDAIAYSGAQYARTLEEAILQSEKMLRGEGTILFSPASASFDMFKNSKDRGEQFSRIVRHKKNSA